MQTWTLPFINTNRVTISKSSEKMCLKSIQLCSSNTKTLKTVKCSVSNMRGGLPRKDKTRRVAQWRETWRWHSCLRIKTCTRSSSSSKVMVRLLAKMVKQRLIAHQRGDSPNLWVPMQRVQTRFQSRPTSLVKTWSARRSMRCSPRSSGSLMERKCSLMRSQATSHVKWGMVSIQSMTSLWRCVALPSAISFSSSQIWTFVA